MSRKPCSGGQAHDDARSLVEFIFEHGGHGAAVSFKNDEIARRLGWTHSHGGGQISADGARYSVARRHAMDCDDDEGRACTGYRLNYRRAGTSSILSLLDPAGDVADHAFAVIGSVLGWISRTRQHQTENGRIVVQMEALGDHALNRGDREGYRLCVQCGLEMEEYATLRPTTMGALVEWIERVQG